MNRSFQNVQRSPLNNSTSKNSYLFPQSKRFAYPPSPKYFLPNIAVPLIPMIFLAQCLHLLPSPNRLSSLAIFDSGTIGQFLLLLMPITTAALQSSIRHQSGVTCLGARRSWEEWTKLRLRDQGHIKKVTTPKRNFPTRWDHEWGLKTMAL